MCWRGAGSGCGAVGPARAANAPLLSFLRSRPSPLHWPRVRRFGKRMQLGRCLLFGGNHDEGLVAATWSGRRRFGGFMLLHAAAAVALFTSWDQRRARLRLQRRCAAADPSRISATHGIRAMATQTNKVTLQSNLTCPECGHVAEETMPTDACQWFYECTSCHTVLKPLPGDCCVYCSYATMPCPPIQEGKSCCA